MRHRSVTGPRLAAAFAVFSLAWFLFAYGLADRMPAGVAGWTSTALYSGWSVLVAGIAVARLARADRERAWIPVGLGLSGMVLGDLLWDLSAHGVIPTPNATPSVMDLCYLPAYAALGLTAIRLVRRYHGGGLGALLDTVVVAAGIGAALVPLVLQPYQEVVSTGSPLSRFLHVLYPVADLLLVTTLAVVAFSGARVRPLRLLGAAAGFCLVADHVWLEQTEAGTYSATGGWVDWLWLAQYTLMAAAVCSRLPAPGPQAAASGPADLARRVSVLVVAALLCPALIVVGYLGWLPSATGAVALEYAVSTLVLVALVCARLVVLLVENARTVRDLRAALDAGQRLSSDLDHQARHDHVTGLPNRRGLAERIGVLADSRPGPHAVVFIDLDDFTAVNDSYGPVLGDVLLRETAGRLRAAARPGDLVARLGSDEFGVLLVGTDQTEALRLATRLVSVISAPVPLAGRTVTIGASAGVATLDGGGPAGADVALYAAKRAGGGRVLSYSEELRDRFVGASSLAADLTRALAEGSLDVAYQPIVDVASGRIAALEALVRWSHPELGPLPPVTFLPIAVERGIVAEIDLLVLDRALGQAGRWCAQLADLRVGFNASAELLARPDAVDAVLGALARHGLPGSVLTIEVTEQSMIDDPTGTAGRLQRLREHGVSVSLDDFGTGYSSLSYLQELPVDVLKLDRSFITRGVGPGGVSALVRSVVHLGHELELTVLAEGIETAEQRRALEGLGCDLGQGFLFAKAMPADQVAAALAAAPVPLGPALPAGLPSQSTPRLASSG